MKKVKTIKALEVLSPEEYPVSFKEVEVFAVNMDEFNKQHGFSSQKWHFKRNEDVVSLTRHPNYYPRATRRPDLYTAMLYYGRKRGKTLEGKALGEFKTFRSAVRKTISELQHI